MTELRTCLECNIENNKCSNRHGCSYRGPRCTLKEREKAWRNYGQEERTIGAYYDYTGRE